ncbi:MAG: hypothetical protein WCG81_01605 [Candidatus Angelobacter sp.]
MIAAWLGAAAGRPSRVINPERSWNVTLFSHQAIKLRRNRLALMQTLPQLRQGWPLRDFSDLSQQTTESDMPAKAARAFRVRCKASGTLRS